MRQIVLVIALVSIMLGLLYVLSLIVYPILGVPDVVRPVVDTATNRVDLQQYAIEQLRVRPPDPQTIILGELVEEKDRYSVYTFSYPVEGLTATGLAHIPRNVQDAPVVVQLRGYAEQATYKPGFGTRPSAAYYAGNGFISLAPDFLGYGDSDNPSENVMEERFQRYITGLVLIESVSNLNVALARADVETTADTDAIALWGHSNGGHIATALLEITGEVYPTSLWNPVSKPFPYSILFYTDQFEDYGKALRYELARFESEYDVDRFSITTYLDWIQAPLIVHQGSADELVPQKWSDEFVENLENLDKDVTYYTYPGNDHNFSQGGWSTVVQRDVRFFREWLEY